MSAGPGEGAGSIVCVSTGDWDAPLWTNKQHLMSRLGARGERVLYIDSLGLRAPTTSASDLGRIGRRLRAWRPTARDVAPGVLRDSPLVIPAHGNPRVRRLNGRLLRSRLRRNERRHRLDDAIVWAYSPPALDMFDRGRHRALVYHCVDDVAAFPGVDAEAFRAGERRLIRAADVCIGSSRPLLDHLEAVGARAVRYWPNPADTVAFSAAAASAPERLDRRVVLGFVGAVQEHKIDVPMILEIAMLRPEWRIDLVGPIGEGLGRSTIHQADMPENVVLRGLVDRQDLPRVMTGFDVGLIPYALNDYTRGVFPLKAFEYLASGLPVVSSPLPSLVGEVEHVRFAASARDFVAAIDLALAEPDGRADRIAYASAFSWENRVAEAERLIAELRGA